MNAWDNLMSIAHYVAYPSFIYMVIYVVMFFMWLFATDFYDVFESDIDHNSQELRIIFIFSVLNALLGYFYKWDNFFNYIFNAFICIVSIIYICLVSSYFLTKFHYYCRSKRGK